MEKDQENNSKKVFGFSAGILPNGKRTLIMNIQSAGIDELSLLKELARQIKKD